MPVHSHFSPSPSFPSLFSSYFSFPSHFTYVSIPFFISILVPLLFPYFSLPLFHVTSTSFSSSFLDLPLSRPPSSPTRILPSSPFLCPHPPFPSPSPPLNYCFLLSFFIIIFLFFFSLFPFHLILIPLAFFPLYSYVLFLLHLPCYILQNLHFLPLPFSSTFLTAPSPPS